MATATFLQISAILFFYVRYYSYISTVIKHIHIMKYPNGYQSKIDYYTYKVNKAIENLDNDSLMFFSDKLNYFIDRQLALKARKC